MQLGVSVIVCCYNSAARLPETIKHIAAQQVPADLPWEVIVVDNASTDNTPAIAQTEWDKHYDTGANFTVVKQPTPGLSHARDKGVETAQYEYLLFCDDDNWLFNDYIARLFNTMKADDSIAVLGGCGIFEPEKPVNDQIESFKNYYVNGEQTWAEKDHWVYGAGSTYRKSLLVNLKQLGWRQITTGRIGKVLLSGEDVEICLMLHLMGYQIKADNQLKFKHFVALKRQNISYIVNLAYWLSYSSALLNSYHVFLNDDKRPINVINNTWLLSALKTFFKYTVILVIQKLIKWKAITIQQKITFNTLYGTCVSLFKNRKIIAAQHLHVKQILTQTGN
jgi:glycosyltransferase involved in cell wall biosynthesis